MKGKPVIPPVHLTATYQFENSDELIDVVANHNGYIYSRWDNPSVFKSPWFQLRDGGDQHDFDGPGQNRQQDRFNA